MLRKLSSSASIPDIWYNSWYNSLVLTKITETSLCNPRIKKPRIPLFKRIPGILEIIDATGFEPAASASRSEEGADIGVSASSV